MWASLTCSTSGADVFGGPVSDDGLMNSMSAGSSFGLCLTCKVDESEEDRVEAEAEAEASRAAVRAETLVPVFLRSSFPFAFKNSIITKY